MGNPTAHLSPLISRVIHSPRVKHALTFIEESAETTTREHITICEIPAPPFGEERRAQYFLRRFLELGLDSVHLDTEGNVIGLRRGQAERPAVVISAHLDTVFPASVNVQVQRRDGRLYAPGIGDNACGLIALIVLLEALNQATIQTAGTLIFLCTVGEEGEGNLRGIRHFLLDGGWATTTDAFISFDGHGAERIVHQALGSRRYRITVTGPGGHSWGDFGIVNPIYALAQIVTQLSGYHLPSSPRTTLNIGRISGGQSVNAIPQTASIDVDFRSTSSVALDQLDEYLKSVVETAVRHENLRSIASSTKLTAILQPLGERPSGQTPLQAEIVRVAALASEALGIQPLFDCASTDSNIPISLGIPAITIGAGGIAGGPHTLDEWYDATNRALGLKRALLLILALAGIVEPC